uniref:Glycine zipper domain-containing protein n=1 Tax=Anopheles dirus TaxID=7168 RepID=A0A182MY42_9DIPT
QFPARRSTNNVLPGDVTPCPGRCPHTGAAQSSQRANAVLKLIIHPERNGKSGECRGAAQPPGRNFARSYTGEPREMCVHGNLIVPLVLLLVALVGLAVGPTLSTPSPAISPSVGPTLSTFEKQPDQPPQLRPKRHTRDPDERNNIESSISLWEWLKGRDKPEDNCMLMAIGGVASGGALTGAFVGAGIGSIFTGPGAIVGGIIGGLVGVFGGLSVGARAGAVACENV